MEKELYEKTVNEIIDYTYTGKDMEVVRQIARDNFRKWGVSIINEINRILNLVPDHRVDIGSDSDTGTGQFFADISDMLRHETYSQGKIWLDNYIRRTGKSKEKIIEELQVKMQIIEKKQEEKNNAIEKLGLEREFEDFGGETFLHFEAVKNFLTRCLEITPKNTKGSGEKLEYQAKEAIMKKIAKMLRVEYTRDFKIRVSRIEITELVKIRNILINEGMDLEDV